MTLIKLGATIFAFLTLTAFVCASESDELQEKAEAMQREAAELGEQGHKKEAANLKRKAMAMLQEAEHRRHDRPDQRHAEIMKMKRLLEKLRLEEKELANSDGKHARLEDVRREAEEVEMKLETISQGPHRKDAAPHDDVVRRMEHMRIAIEHLNHAGLHDVARHVAEKAEATERELHGQHDHHEGDVMREVMKQLDELRHEVGRLRDEVNEVREIR